MKKFKDIKLSIKLITVGMTAVLIPMLIVGYISVSTASRALMESGLHSTYRVAQDLALTTELFMTEEIKFARELALIPYVQETVNQVDENGLDNTMETVTALDAIFKKHHDQIGADYDLFFITNAGGAIISDSMNGALRTKKINIGDRAYFKRAKSSGKTVIGRPIKSRASGKSVVAIAVPLKDDSGKFAGVLCSVLKLAALSSKLTTVKIGKTGYAYMMNSEGILIAHPNTEFLFKLNLRTVKGMEEVSRMMIAKESGYASYVFEGVKKVAGFAQVPMTG